MRGMDNNSDRAAIAAGAGAFARQQMRRHAAKMDDLVSRLLRFAIRVAVALTLIGSMAACAQDTNMPQSSLGTEPVPSVSLSPQISLLSLRDLPTGWTVSETNSKRFFSPHCGSDDLSADYPPNEGISFRYGASPSGQQLVLDHTIIEGPDAQDVLAMLRRRLDSCDGRQDEFARIVDESDAFSFPTRVTPISLTSIGIDAEGYEIRVAFTMRDRVTDAPKRLQSTIYVALLDASETQVSVVSAWSFSSTGGQDALPVIMDTALAAIGDSLAAG